MIAKGERIIITKAHGGYIVGAPPAELTAMRLEDHRVFSTFEALAEWLREHFELPYVPRDGR